MALKIDYGYDFERFWREYPKKVGKGDAHRAFKQLKLSTEDVNELVLHLERRKREDAKWIEGKYIPNPGTFLRQHRWEDDYPRVCQHSGRDWSGKSYSDEENARIYWNQVAAKGGEVPAKYQHLLAH